MPRKTPMPEDVRIEIATRHALRNVSEEVWMERLALISNEFLRAKLSAIIWWDYGSNLPGGCPEMRLMSLRWGDHMNYVGISKDTNKVLIEKMKYHRFAASKRSKVPVRPNVINDGRE